MPLSMALLDPIREPSNRQLSLQQFSILMKKETSTDLFEFLVHHNIAAIWWHKVQEQGLSNCLRPILRTRLMQWNSRCLARSMVVANRFTMVAAHLNRSGLPWVCFKGEHLARVLYAHKHLRPSSDIDIMISSTDRGHAMRLLSNLGFICTKPCVRGHEMTYEGHGLVIDLHWQQLGQGWSRIDLAHHLLEGRVQANVEGKRESLWFPSETSTTVLLLLHPPVTERFCGPLSRAYDLDQWLRHHARNLEASAALIKRAGLGAAAWLMLQKCKTWFGTPIPTELERQLRPRYLRRCYLRSWMNASEARELPAWCSRACKTAMPTTARDLLRLTRFWAQHTLSQRLLTRSVAFGSDHA